MFIYTYIYIYIYIYPDALPRDSATVLERRVCCFLSWVYVLTARLPRKTLWFTCVFGLDCW